jgi:hypothetical protein
MPVVWVSRRVVGNATLTARYPETTLGIAPYNNNAKDFTFLKGHNMSPCQRRKWRRAGRHVLPL